VIDARVRKIHKTLAALGAPAGTVATREPPIMLATLADRPPTGPGWLFELKWDGVRVLASRNGGPTELVGRSGQVVTGRYPEIARALDKLPLDRFVLDGEVMALDERGRPSFQRLQARMGLSDPRDVERAMAQVAVEAAFFDCLALDGRDLRGLPLVARKDCLRLLLPDRGPVRRADHVTDDGAAYFAAAGKAGLEGIVAKRMESRYTAGRSREWLKVKSQQRQELVIGGYTDPQGSRGYFGALHLGVYEPASGRGVPRLVYAGRVGTGFDEKTLRAISAALRPLRRETSPFAVGSPPGRGHHWVEPRLVAEVRFTEWTDDGLLRHPAFLGLRNDKRPEECVREVAAPEPPRARTAPPKRAATRSKAAAGSPAAPSPAEARTKLTNLHKVFWPADGYTKGDLIAYYDAVAPWLLPYLKDRPVVLTRYPDGITGKSFFQQDAPDSTPSWIRTERLHSKDANREIDYFVLDDAESLRYVANLGTIPLHLWSARVGALDRPDWLVLDLDPKGAPFTDVVTVAQTLHRILDDLSLPSYPKTSGASGLHILVPLGARYGHEDARTFARLLALLAVEAASAISTVVRPIRGREGKVYVDFGQNGHGRTIVAPFAVRPLPGAPASCPLEWSEVTARLDPTRFTIKTLPARLEKTGDLLAPVLKGSIDMAAAVARIEGRAASVKPSRGEAPAAPGRKPGRRRTPRA